MNTLDELKQMIFDMTTSSNLIDLWLSKADDETIEWVAQNRIYAETIRYTKKAEFNAAMQKSTTINNKINLIKSMYSVDDVYGSTVRFLKSLYNDLLLLEKVYCWGVNTSDNTNLSFLKVFWSQASIISNIDNANAMCFASDNWNFSVFHAVIDAMCDIIGEEQVLSGGLLTAGIQDVRTKVYSQTRTGSSIEYKEYLRSIRTQKKYIYSDGVMPIFTWLFDSNSSCNTISTFTNIYNSDEIERIPGYCDEFKHLYDVYKALYLARVQYDTYEYYGRFSFLRNYMIKVSYDEIAKINMDLAETFRYYSSTYNYDGALCIIDQIGG